MTQLVRPARWLWPLALGLSLGCQQASPKSAAGGSVSAAPLESQAKDWVSLLPWGTARGEVGLRRAQPDWPADGVSAVAAGPGDGALLLDRLNGRVVWTGPKGARVVAEAPSDAEDLAVGPDGAYALHSLVRARVWLYEGANLAGTLAVDRSLRELVGVSVGASRRLALHNASQETWPLGSPAAPASLTATLHGKREGAFLLRDGAGVAVRLTRDQTGALGGHGHPELLVLAQGQRARVTTKHLLPDRVLSARVVGVAGRVACLRLEGGEHGATVRVTRRVVCHDVDSGARVLDHALGAPGLYVPRRELSVGEAPARVVFIHPEDKGLRVHTWALPTAEVRR